MLINIKKYIETLFKLGIFLILLCTIIPYLPIRLLPIDLLSHFQVYYLAITVFVFFISILLKLKNIQIYLICIISFLLAFNSIKQYTGFNYLTPKVINSFKVMQVNVFKFNFDYTPLLEQINKQQPDIIALSETTPKWREGLKSLEKNWPYIIDHSQWGSHGMIIFSKSPFTKQTVKYWGSDKIPTILFNVKLGNNDIHFVSLHPLPPVCMRCFKSRDTNFDEIAKALKQQNKKIIVLGDMNTTMFSPSYKKFMQETGLKNTRTERGLYPTWPTTLPEIFRIPIDHILHSDNLTTVFFETLPSIGSDHLPTIAVFQASN